MATSNTYDFGTNTQIDDLIRESFERIGIIGNDFTGLQIQSAIMSANLELTSWQGKIPLQWTRKRFMTSLLINQPTYLLPETITRVIDMVAIQTQSMNTGGTAASSAGGNAANCFDPNSTAGCIQVSANGNISYDYGAGNLQALPYFGITALPNADPSTMPQYTIAIDYTLDGNLWQTGLLTPLTDYAPNSTVWWVMENNILAQAYRIRETGGQTLRIQSIYLAQPTTTGSGDRAMLPLSYTEWMQIPIKNAQGFPSSYFFNAQISPYMNLWPILGPAPVSNQYNALLYTAYRYTQDVFALFNEFEIPQRFYDALVAGIAARLAMKFAPERRDMMKSEAMEAFANATLTDQTPITMRFQPDFNIWV